MAKERKVLTRRVNRYHVEDVGAYESLGGLVGLRRALSMTPVEVIEQVTQSGLTGRGGAGFSTGLKWAAAARQPQGRKYLICNADEGELGTFKDRLLLESDPWSVLEGIVIAAYAIGANRAIIYIRGDYDSTIELWTKIATLGEQAGLLGKRVLDNDFGLALQIARGRGLYIAGEESALIASLEMSRPMGRLKPPYPAERGLFGAPTVVNNVETLANVPVILADCAEAFWRRSDVSEPGTRLFSLSGDVHKPGVYEVELGSTTLRALIHDLAGGPTVAAGIKAVQPGGGTSALLPSDQLDCLLTSEAIRQAGSIIGTGAVIVYGHGRSAVEIAGELLDYYGDESCGRCMPCRIGTQRLHEIVTRLRTTGGTSDDLARIREIAGVCGSATLCGFGQSVSIPVMSALAQFPEDFEACIHSVSRSVAGGTESGSSHG